VSPVAREKAREKETRDYGRGHRTSGRAAERYAKRARDAEATRAATRERKREEKKRADPFRRSWQNQREQQRRRPRGSLQNHMRFFLSIPGMEYETDEDVEELWDSYLRNMVFGARRTRLNTMDNPFWEDMGIAPEDFNWRGWREQMGYNKKRK
jgi:hypothetical protein